MRIHTQPVPPWDRTQVAALSAVSFRCMQLFSVRIPVSIIHENLTEFACDLLHTVYKYSPYGFFTLFLKYDVQQKLYEDFSTSKDVNI